MIALRSSKVLAPLATVVVVAGIAVGVSVASGGDSGPPRALRLAGSGTAEAATMAAPAGDSKLAAGGGYVLTGELPSGTPDDAPAYDLAGGPGAAGPVARLADAFDLGTPTRTGEGWSAGGLQVMGDSGRPWYFSPCSPDSPVASDAPKSSASSSAVCASYDIGTSTSTSSGSGSAPAAGIAVGEPAPATDVAPAPLPEPRTPTEAEVRAAAAPVLEALDLSGGRVEVYAGGGSLVVDPEVDGLPTVNRSTYVNVDAAGKLAGASGWLATPERGDRYPLVTAKAAYDALPQLATTMLCPVSPDGTGGCGTAVKTEVTGARLGLTMSALAKGGQVLVPAWLFDVKGSPQPIAGVAVDPAYLPAPEQPTIEPDIAVDPAAGGGTEPGTSGPAGKQPAGSEPNSDLPRTQIAVVGWTESQADNAVTVLYDNGGCGQQDVRADVKEDAQHVYVLLTATAPAPDQVCAKNYVEAPYEVALQAPLGTRDVVHAATGEPVPKK